MKEQTWKYKYTMASEVNNFCCADEISDREGTSTMTRFLKMLDPVNAPVDPANIQDVLVFAKKYADLVRFYDMNDPVDWVDFETGSILKPCNEDPMPYPKSLALRLKTMQAPDDEKSKNITTWKEFIYKDIAVVVASVAEWGKKLWHVKKEYSEKREDAKSNPTKDNYRELFVCIVHHMKRIQRWYDRSIEEHPLKKELEIKIRSFLAPALKKLISYDKGMLVNTHDDMDMISQYESFKSEPWNCDYAKINLDSSIYTGNNFKEKILHSILYIDDIFNTMFKSYEEITQGSGFYWQQAIEKYHRHEPHMALFIAFVELFAHAKNDLNNLTRKHLDFFYREVLHLTEKPAHPDSVYLIYELAKGVDEFDLTEETELTVGKDALGKQLVYKTDKDLVINSAKVKEIKTIFLDKVTQGDAEIIRNMYAAPVANSADGNGKEFTEEEAAWSTFGYFESDKNKTGDFAQIGFAFTSPILFLSMGERKIEFSMDGSNAINFDISHFEVFLTGENGWINLMMNENFGKGTPPDKYHFLIPTSEEAIIAFNAEIHSGSFLTEYPVAKFILKKKPNPITRTLESYYDDYKNFKIKSIKIDVNVTGLTDTLLMNDEGSLDPQKPFYPFGQKPVIGSSFYIGAKELEGKNITSMGAVGEWLGKLDFPNRYIGYTEFKPQEKQPTVVSEGNSSVASTNQTPNTVVFERTKYEEYTAKSYYYKKNEWITNDKISPIDLFIIQRDSENSDSAEPLIIWNFYFNDDNPEVTEKNNYKLLKLTLNKLDFGHDLYPTLVSQYLAKRLKIVKVGEEYQIAPCGQYYEACDIFVPATPADIKIKNISINYSASQTLSYSNSQFFHIYPFGVLVYRLSFVTNQKNFLLPQFRFGAGSNQYNSSEQQQGNLYIGIENLKPPQNLSLLFKFADGTAYDNDSDPPGINWSYLVNNEWRPLPFDNVVSDSTYGFQTNGIILIDFPGDATNNNTLITAGLHWLCASIDKDGDKIPKLIDVIAQANQATFYDQQNDPAHYQSPLPAESISKPLVKIPEIKVITQPFESFDGKPREEGKQFHQRVSERLRHKGRAITPKDYEHLILEEFPSVYKVKVLSHTDPNCLCRFYTVEEDVIINREKKKITVQKCCCPQVAPGHILVVPVSNLRNKNAVDPLKPRTGRRTLLKIEEFLKPKVSPFVHVHAKNPKFEEVKVSFNVKFNSGVDKGYFTRKLNDDIIQYLTPWAFDSSVEVMFGNTIYASKIINFIEELDYVDYITCFRMIHILEACCEIDSLKDMTCSEMQKSVLQKPTLSTIERINTEATETVVVVKTETQDRLLTEISATSQQAILVSAKQHCITVIEEKSSGTNKCS